MISPFVDRLVNPELLSDGRYLISAERAGIGLSAHAIATANDLQKLGQLLKAAARRYQPLGIDYAAIAAGAVLHVWFVELVDAQHLAQDKPSSLDSH